MEVDTTDIILDPTSEDMGTKIDNLLGSITGLEYVDADTIKLEELSETELTVDFENEANNITYDVANLQLNINTVLDDLKAGETPNMAGFLIAVIQLTNRVKSLKDIIKDKIIPYTHLVNAKFKKTNVMLSLLTQKIKCNRACLDNIQLLSLLNYSIVLNSGIILDKESLKRQVLSVLDKHACSSSNRADLISKIDALHRNAL